MSEKPQDKAPIEEPNEDTNLFIVDPEDYQKTKKIQTIHQTKKEVLKTRRNRQDLIPELGEKFRESGNQVYQHRLAQTVAQYGSELLPLIEEALDQGTLEESDVTVDEFSHVDIREFIAYDGYVEENGEYEVANETTSLAVYRQIDRIGRKLGLGLKFGEDKGPAEI